MTHRKVLFTVAESVILAALAGCGAPPTMTMMMPDAAATCVPPGARPSQRFGWSAVYLRELGRVFAYGGDTAPFDPSGMTPSAYTDEVWSYDTVCGLWQKLTPGAGPGRRGLYAAALDERRHRVLVVGGRDYESKHYHLHNDVWAFDTTTSQWSQLAPTGTPPAPRQSHRIVYDPTADRLVLFGGNTQTMFGAAPMADTWELDFAGTADGTWKPINATGPSARQDMATARDAKRNLWLLVGGASSFINYFSDSWAFDLGANRWTRLTTGGDVPSARFRAEMVDDPARDQRFLFGGHDAGNIGLQNDSYVFHLGADGKSGTWTNLLPGDSALDVSSVDHASPERRDKHGMTILGNTVWLGGGITDCGPIDDVWLLDLTNAKAWSNPWHAQQGETCVRRAKPGQTCPSDCGNPL